jgi:hypothetical protein
MVSTLRDMRKLLLRNPTLTAKQLKAMLPALENISIRTIQRICLAKLKLPSRKMEPKPLLTQAMKDKMDDSQYLRNLVESMPRRLEDVIRMEGNLTKY